MRKKKFKRVSVCGTHTYVPVKKDHEREKFPCPAVFEDKSKYNRRREKQRLRKEIEQ